VDNEGEEMIIIRFKTFCVDIPTDKNRILEVYGRGKVGGGMRKRRVYLFIWTKDSKWKIWDWIVSF
jgi:hypothetical protein